MAKKKPASFAFTAPPKWPEPNTEKFAAAKPEPEHEEFFVHYPPSDTGEPDSKEACQVAMDHQHKLIETLTEKLAQARNDLNKLIAISRRYK